MSRSISRSQYVAKCSTAYQGIPAGQYFSTTLAPTAIDSGRGAGYTLHTLGHTTRVELLRSLLIFGANGGVPHNGVPKPVFSRVPCTRPSAPGTAGRIAWC